MYDKTFNKWVNYLDLRSMVHRDKSYFYTSCDWGLTLNLLNLLNRNNPPSVFGTLGISGWKLDVSQPTV